MVGQAPQVPGATFSMMPAAGGPNPVQVRPMNIKINPTNAGPANATKIQIQPQPGMYTMTLNPNQAAGVKRKADDGH